MANDPSLPNARVKFLDAAGLPVDSWRKFLEKLSRQPSLTGDQSAAILALSERVTTLEEASQELGGILGLGSVSVTGSLGGQVVIQLQGDTDAPGPSFYYGTDAAGQKGWNPVSSRGITVTGGSMSGAVIPLATIIGGLSASDYTLTGNWYLWCSPTGSIELDVRRAAFGSLPPGPGDSICGGNEPAVAAGLSASGAFTGWTTSIARNDALSVVVNSVTDVTWFVLLLEAV
ncbi:hypothetical protein [Pseudoxanthomonas sp. CF125]|uniref:hypothetical protein n=1 Tax=Pseudoxanthomonas sp. CF125 TaxID=1855303 RepID=UPI00088A424B|nr:hypothetical protein [Pseudoxanthomonas sp. CF125]SDQ41869.1 hypothetical protein SAMN05216569_1051 [Pseudoxanthomonas sp. CF125]